MSCDFEPGLYVAMPDETIAEGLRYLASVADGVHAWPPEACLTVVKRLRQRAETYWVPMKLNYSDVLVSWTRLSLMEALEYLSDRGVAQSKLDQLDHRGMLSLLRRHADDAVSYEADGIVGFMVTGHA